MTKEDERIGMAWWNELTKQERVRVLVRAVQHKANASVADAFELWRQGVISTEPEPLNSDISDRR
jgi:hypothetical protein